MRSMPCLVAESYEEEAIGVDTKKCEDEDNARIAAEGWQARLSAVGLALVEQPGHLRRYQPVDQKLLLRGRPVAKMRAK